MRGDLFPRGPLTLAQFAAEVLPRLCQERQDRLITLLPAMLRVVSFAGSHLTAYTVCTVVSVSRTTSRNCTWAASQTLSRHHQVQRGQKAPKRALHPATGSLPG